MIDSNNYQVQQNNGGFYHGEISRSTSSQSRAVSVRPCSMTSKSLDNSKKEQEKKSQSQNKNFKPFIQFFVSYVGLIFAVILYVAGGAYLFQILEQHNSVQNCQIGEGEWDNLRVTYRTWLFNYIFFNTTSNPWLPVDNSTIIPSLNTPRDGPWIYNPKITEKLNEFADKILEISSGYGYTGQNCEQDNLWEYFSALLFTVTIVTTIGYGHIAPKTWEGQIVCICYATLGIPLFLMSLTKVSFILADVFRYLYRRVFCVICINAWNSTQKKAENDLDELKKSNSSNEETCSIEGTLNNRQQSQEINNLIKDKPIVEIRDEEEFLTDQDDSRVKIPLVIVVGCLLAYIVFGAYIFTLLEDWSWVKGIYYCYISLATIGFGDVVPGISQIQTDKGVRNVIIAIIYIFIGMANLVMCYDLMEEQLTDKFKSIAIKLGFSSEEEREETIQNIKPQVEPTRDLKIEEFKEKRYEFADQKNLENEKTEFYKEPTQINVRSRNYNEDASSGFENMYSSLKAPNFQT